VVVCEYSGAETNNIKCQQKTIIPVAAFTANETCRSWKQPDEGMDAGLTVNEIKEILIHSYAYAVFRVLEWHQYLHGVLDNAKNKDK